MSKPSVLFVSSCDISTDSVIQKVINSPLRVSRIEEIDENITLFEWQIDNKYYTANINLCSVKSKSISNAAFADTVEAVVLCFDGFSQNGLTQAESWLPFLNVYDPEIKILVCERCCGDSDSTSFKRNVLEWCIERGFELVELDPNPEDVDEDDAFPETLGIERIRQALNAHQWFNLNLKENDPSPRLPIEDSASGAHSNLLNESLDELLDSDSFGDLFVQLADFKTRVSGLSGEERKDVAEQVVRAFWNALGNDDDDL